MNPDQDSSNRKQPTQQGKDLDSHPIAGDLDAAASDTTKQTPNENLKEYILWPKDGTNKAAVQDTENNIKKITGQTKITSDPTHDPEPEGLSSWLVEATATQLDLIPQDPGIDSVEENLIFDMFEPEESSSY